MKALLLLLALALAQPADAKSHDYRDRDADPDDAKATSSVADDMDAEAAEAAHDQGVHDSAHDGTHDSDADPAADEARPEASADGNDTGTISEWSPTPFSASYRVRYQGVPFTATGTRSLEQQDDGSWYFRARVRAFMIRLQETSTFEQGEDGILRSRHYTYDRSGIAGSRERDVTFDWDARRIFRHDRQDEHDFEELIYDPVSWQLAMQRELMLNDVEAGDRFEYPVSNGGEPDVYLFEVIGEEDIDVPAGSFRTLKLERVREQGDDQTRVWVAREHDYLLVKLEHDDGRLLTLSLEDY